jgi:ABC-type nitrate/sulfonate/bicarbonate transport system substrate-binding protein
MNQQDSAVSNPRPDTREEDEDRKAEASRLVAEYFRAVVEARREWAELERITSKDSRRPAELERSILEERLSIIEGLIQDARERSGRANELLEAAKAIMTVFHDDFK